MAWWATVNRTGLASTAASSSSEPPHRTRVTWNTSPSVNSEAVGDHRQVEPGSRVGEHLVAAVGAGGDDRRRAQRDRGVGDDLAPRLGSVVAEQFVVRLVDGGDAVRRQLGDERVGGGADREGLDSVVALGGEASGGGDALERGWRDRPAVVLDDGEDHFNTPSDSSRSTTAGTASTPAPSTTVFDACSAGARSRTIVWPPGSAAAGTVVDRRPSSTPAGPSSSGSGGG